MKYFLLGFLFHAFDSQVKFDSIQEYGDNRFYLICWPRRQNKKTRNKEVGERKKMTKA